MHLLQVNPNQISNSFGLIQGAIIYSEATRNFLIFCLSLLIGNCSKRERNPKTGLIEFWYITKFHWMKVQVMKKSDKLLERSNDLTEKLIFNKKYW